MRAKVIKSLQLLMLTILTMGVLAIGDVIVAGTCDYFEVTWTGSSCGVGIPSASVDWTVPSSDAAACAALCGCFGKKERGGCSFTY